MLRTPWIIRSRDLLALRFVFVNLKLATDPAEPRLLVRERADEPAYIIVQFPPQHVAEQAFYETASAGYEDPDPDKPTTSETPKVPARTRVATA